MLDALLLVLSLSVSSSISPTTQSEEDLYFYSPYDQSSLMIDSPNQKFSPFQYVDPYEGETVSIAGGVDNAAGPQNAAVAPDDSHLQYASESPWRDAAEIKIGEDEKSVTGSQYDGKPADMYYFLLHDKSELDIRLESVTGVPLIDFDLQLFDERGRFLFASYNGGNAPERIHVTINGGCYYVKVYAYPADYDAKMQYRLSYKAEYAQVMNVFRLYPKIKQQHHGLMITNASFPFACRLEDHAKDHVWYRMVTNYAYGNEFPVRSITFGEDDHGPAMDLYIWNKEDKQKLLADLESIDTVIKGTKAKLEFVVEKIGNLADILGHIQIFKAFSTACEVVDFLSAYTLFVLGHSHVEISDASKFSNYIERLKGNLDNSPEGEVIRIQTNYSLIYENDIQAGRWWNEYYRFRISPKIPDKTTSCIYTDSRVDNCMDGHRWGEGKYIDDSSSLLSLFFPDK